jgi:signal transduction histidine kinase
MNRIARLIAISLCLLAVFLAAVVASWIRLRHQTEALRMAAVETRKSQLERVLAITKPGSLPWSDAYLRDLSTILDAEVVAVADKPSRQKAQAGAAWSFEYTLSSDNGQPGSILVVNFTPPPAARLGHFYRHTALILLVIALGLLTVLVVILIFGLNARSESFEKASAKPRPGQEIDSLTHLAKMSASQLAELERERGERLRADEDIHYQQVLLNRALEEKILLGRELHDGIIQSLYATGLTLEAAKKHLASSPSEAASQLDSGLKALNATIREIRSYINGLAPERIQQQNFASTVQSLAQSLGSGRDATFEYRIDDSASAKLSEERRTQLLQIVREAISNGLRHGSATHIAIRLHENNGELGLLVQDNGIGFDPVQAQRGHGLDNIKARAERINAGLKITSAPGEGTRLVITLPLSRPQSP